MRQRVFEEDMEEEIVIFDLEVCYLVLRPSVLYQQQTDMLVKRAHFSFLYFFQFHFTV